MPLRIYSTDGKLMQEFGERLQPLTFDEIPKQFIAALLDTEDKRFFQHGGIDLITILNATYQLVRNKGTIQTGGSTITMQLVKNISGNKEIKFIRKFKEMLLALKIERELTKEKILTLYLNTISFGKHALGIQAAANTYYGKNVSELNLAQMAMLAGVPKAPEAGNPINGPGRAQRRRNLVLLRMLEQASITQAQYNEAVAAPITAKVHKRVIELPALYAAEMVRKQLKDKFGSNIYKKGLVVRTTLDSRMQLAAENAVQSKLNEYDRRHGYRGPELRSLPGTAAHIEAQALGRPDIAYPSAYCETLVSATTIGNQRPGIVVAVKEKAIDVLTTCAPGFSIISIEWPGLSWARPYINVDRRGPKPRTASDIVSMGDLIRYQRNSDGALSLGQVPDIQGALIALDPNNGAIRALVGGYDFNAQQYNRATQARRQPGSIFKPFLYAGAMQNGLTAASIFNDGYLTLPGGDLEELKRFRSPNKPEGNLRLREALYKSKNTISLRVLLDYGVKNAIAYVHRFGFDTSNFPRNTQLALGGGTMALTPKEIATGYAVFANGGFEIAPYLIASYTTKNAAIHFAANPPTVCISACDALVAPSRAVEPRLNYIMNTMLADVVKRGTATKAWRALKRSDLKGKTGTANNSADTWFSGYTHDLVATTWAGFDNHSPAGNREWGSTTPLETWIEFMRVALPPENQTSKQPLPDKLAWVKIDPKTGKRTAPDDADGIDEIFREEHAPPPGNNRPDRGIQRIF